MYVKKYIYSYKPVFFSKKQCKDWLLKSKYHLNYNNQEFSITNKLKQHNLDSSEFVKLLKITDSEYKILENCMYNWHLHFSHPIFLVNIIDVKTGEVIKRMYTLTSKPYDITVVETLTLSYFNITDKTCKVIKVNEGLYVTGHSWISDIDLNRNETNQLDFQEFYYDIEKGYYVGVDKYSGKVWDVKNLTLDNIKKLNNIISKELLLKDQLDITLMVYPVDDLFSYKLLKSGIYNNNIYNEIAKNNIENMLSDHFKFSKNEVMEGLEKKTELTIKKPEDEL